MGIFVEQIFGYELLATTFTQTPLTKHVKTAEYGLFTVVAEKFQIQQPKVFNKKRCLKISQNIREKHLCQILYFNKVAGLRPAIY